jgi:type II secretory pathway component PulF
MTYFKYKLIEPTGRIASGIARLPYKDEISALAYLERGDNMAIYVKRMTPVVSFFLQLVSMSLRKKVKRSFQAEFLSNVSVMLRSGVTLTSALEEAAGDSESPDFEADIKNMILSIEGGSNFSDAAENYPHIFPKTVIYLIRLGEETGKLDRMLMDAAEHLKRVQKIVSDTKQALLYPCFVFIAMGAGLLFWFYYVVPKIVSLFKAMDVSLPALTVFLLRLSIFVQDHCLDMILGLTILMVLIMLGYRRSRGIRKAIDVLMLKLPVSGTILSASVLAFITEYFHLLLNAGIDVLKSMDILKASIKNEVYRQKLAEVKEGLTKGDGIAESFRRPLIFPTFVVRMISVGEHSGTLPEQLSYIAEEYRNKLSVIVATIGKMIEPIVLIIAGGMFAIILIGLFLPIYDLVSAVSNR